jgi:hypothetical protein
MKEKKAEGFAEAAITGNLLLFDALLFDALLFDALLFDALSFLLLGFLPFRFVFARCKESGQSFKKEAQIPAFMQGTFKQGEMAI